MINEIKILRTTTLFFYKKEFISTQTHPYLIYPLCAHVRDITIETSFEECKLQEPRFPVPRIKRTFWFIYYLS